MYDEEMVGNDCVKMVQSSLDVIRCIDNIIKNFSFKKLCIRLVGELH